MSSCGMGRAIQNTNENSGRKALKKKKGLLKQLLDKMCAGPYHFANSYPPSCY